MRLALTGDVMLGRLVDKHIISNSALAPEHVWGNCLPLLHGADLRLINLECVVASSGRPWRLWEKAFHFRARPRAIEVLKSAKIDFVSLANNHSLDYGTGALGECVELLDQAGIACCGAGQGRTRARQPAFLTKGGETIAIVSMTDNEPLWEAKGSEWGTFYIDYSGDGLREPYLSHVKRAIDVAGETGGMVIVCAHVGANWGPPTPAMQALARQIIDMGADCYWGHSNHTPQAVEVYKKKPILYSTGDFVDDYAVHPAERNDLSFLFILERRGSEWSLTMYPTGIKNFQVNRVYGEEASWVMNRMKNSSRDFGTRIRQEREKLVITSGQEDD